MYFKALREEEFGKALQQQLGLSSTPLNSQQQKRSLLESLVQAADKMYSQDGAVKEAREHLRDIQQQLHQRGFIHVVSAGNQGYLSREMHTLGVSSPDGFFTNEFASPHSIIVGAADNGSLGIRGDGYGVASLASPGAGAHIAADGVARPLLVDGENGSHSGSSYAAPQGSSVIVDLIRADNDITPEEILAQLQNSATPVPGAEDYLGAGVLGQPEILLCTHGSDGWK